MKCIDSFLVTSLYLVGWILLVIGEKRTKLVNNGYEGVVIAIDPNVPEDQRLLDAIKIMMTEASIAMFQATKNRAYFKDITILVPKSWTGGIYSYASSETFESADIRVAPPREFGDDTPYAWSYSTCGKHGEYIHLTPAYITQDDVSKEYGPRGKVVVHEWGHYRWGVKDEHATGRNATERHANSFYLDANGEVQATRCSLGIRGEYKSRSSECEYVSLLPLIGCEFIEYGTQPEELSTSLMYGQYIEKVTMFCHDDPSDELNMHNKEAPNNQNKACNYRSAWDVIMSSEDFLRGAINEPMSSDANTVPNFRVTKHQSKRIVLVLDTSGSMAGDKILIQRRSSEVFIKSSIGDGSLVGLVTFASVATILENLTEVNHGDGSRDRLAAVLPTVASGGTGIGDGILKGIEVLEASGRGTAGGQLVVLTDGKENRSPSVEDVAQEVLNKGIVIHAVFFGLVDVDDGQPLAILSEDSEGSWYFASDTTQSRSQLQNVFATLSRPDDGDLSSAAVQISSSDLHVIAGTSFRSSVAIDSSVGNRTEFIFSWSTIEPEIVLTPPNSSCVFSNVLKENVSYCSTIHVTDIATSTIRFTIPGTAEVGRWTYAVSSTLNDDSSTLIVTSAPSTEGVYPITVSPELRITNDSANEAALVIAGVFQGYVPLLGASVSAVISRPDGEDVTLQLLDNGAGADVTVDDGVYTRYFTNFSSQGRYSVQVIVTKSESEPTGTANIPAAPANRGVLSDDGTFIPNPNYVAPVNEVSGVKLEGDLQRIASSPGIVYTGSITTKDSYPPNKITDLLATQIDLENATAGIRLTFTAPGDDYDSGTATRYDIRMTNESAFYLLSEFDSQIPVNTSDFLQPKPALEKEEIHISVPPRWIGETSVRISIAIRGFDEVDNPSEVSNVGSTTFFFEPPPRAPKSDGINTWIIVGAAVGGGLVLIAIIAVVAICVSRRKLWMKIAC